MWGASERDDKHWKIRLLIFFKAMASRSTGGQSKWVEKRRQREHRRVSVVVNNMTHDRHLQRSTSAMPIVEKLCVKRTGTVRYLCFIERPNQFTAESSSTRAKELQLFDRACIPVWLSSRHLPRAVLIQEFAPAYVAIAFECLSELLKAVPCQPILIARKGNSKTALAKPCRIFAVSKFQKYYYYPA